MDDGTPVPPEYPAAGLATTDPEFVAIFDRWVNEEVMSVGRLSPERRYRVTLAALIALHAVADYRDMLGAALDAGVTPTEVKEIVYQAMAYAGHGIARDALDATNEVLAARGVALPLPNQSTTTPETRMERGLDLQVKVFGEPSRTAYERAPHDQRHIRAYLTGNCFGDYVTRGGLDLADRELVTFAIVVALGGCEPQVKAHIRGNANLGNGRHELIDVATQLLPWIGYPRTLNAMAVINELLPRGAQG